ncbi:MAG: hypothetical protein CMB56_006920 [Methanobacteriota archaeon]|nr:MAG: hypothetical protein CMB56_006920 [Euryarchaeota archaeon]
MHYYFPGMAVGVILIQSAIIAPTLFKLLTKEEFSVVIRSLWPKFFIFLGVIGIGSLVTLLMHNDPSIIQYIIAGSTIIFSFTCYVIIPATNRATDQKNEKMFKILHKTSVYLTILMLISNIGFLFT